MSRTRRLEHRGDYTSLFSPASGWIRNWWRWDTNPKNNSRWSCSYTNHRMGVPRHVYPAVMDDFGNLVVIRS